MTAIVSHRLQEAVFALLNQNQALSLKLTGVHDQAPAEAKYPYISFGETSFETADLKDRAGVSVTFTVSVWSVETSQMQVKELMADVDAGLNGAEIDLVGFDYGVIELTSGAVQRQFDEAITRYEGKLTYSCTFYQS